MLKVYGVSDDLVEIDGAAYPADEIGCYGGDVAVVFTDGTVAKVSYPKRPGLGVWKIEVETVGKANMTLTECFDEDADPYSDVLEIDAELASWAVIDREND